MKKIYFLLLMVLGVGGVWGQTNPTAFDLSTGNWTLTGWNSGVPAASYPGNGATGANATTGVVAGAANANMVFWTYTGDPGVAANAGNNFSGTYVAGNGKVVGNGANGFYFDNTGAVGIGSAVLSINTSARNTITVGWTAKTIATGARQYGIRLQYRVGTSGAFTDASATATDILYTGGTAGSSQAMTTITLPVAAENNSVVQLLWRFYYIGPSTGTRPQFGIDEITVASSASSATPTKLAITTISPTSPTAGAPFSVTVQSQDATNAPANVATNTTVNLSLITGTGTLGGTLTGVINAGTNSVTIPSNTYSVGETGVVIQAADASAALTAGTKTFDVLAAASQLAFVGVPSSGGSNSPLTTFTVEARRPDNTVDNTYTGTITVSKASGSGTLSGTVSVAAVAGVATFSTLQFDLPDTYTLNADATGLTQATSGPITITTASAATDYFRTNVINGNWTTPATWQSSPDNATWQTATLAPNASAAMIYITAGDTAVVSSNVTAAQIDIQAGGVINNTGTGIFTIQDGTGDDMVIENGGVFIAAASVLSPAFGATGVRINVNTGGIFRVAKTGYTGAGAGVNSVNFTFQNASILEYATTSAYSASGVTYFPNVDAVTIPIFRTTAATSVGGGSNTVFNGLFEANAAATFTGAGTKTFRNGIIGTANVDGSASGKFIINGATSTLGGAGTLILPATGLDLGNATSSTSTLSSAKSITGNIALQTNSLVQLGNNNLTVSGTISNGSATSYIATTGTGNLTINNIGTTPTIFPVGNATDYTPASITNNGTVDNFSVNVAAATPCDADPLQSVNRVWTISEGTAGGSNANITMQWNGADENVSFAHGYCAAVHCAGGAVDIKGANATAGGGDPYTQTITGISSFSPFGVTSDLVILPISIEYLHASKQGANHNLAWKVNCTNTPSVAITLERSSNGRDFKPVYNITATALQCQQEFAYTDANPVAGVNYYRLKITGADGKFSYSSVVALLNATKGLEIVNVTPNPIVGGQFKLNVTSAQTAKMDVVITDMQGRVVSRSTVNILAGFNAIDMNIANLTAGVYQLQGNTQDGRTRTLNLVKQ